MPDSFRPEQLHRPDDGGGRDARTGPSAESCILSGGGANIQAGKIVFDYAGAADPIATIQSLVNASYDNGKWDVGQFRDSIAAATGMTLGLLDNTAATR